MPRQLNLLFGKMKNKHYFGTINLFLESYSIVFCNSLEISYLNNLKSLNVAKSRLQNVKKILFPCKQVWITLLQKTQNLPLGENLSELSQISKTLVRIPVMRRKNHVNIRLNKRHISFNCNTGCPLKKTVAKITTNYNEGKTCKIKLKYFTVSFKFHGFINSSVCFYIKFLGCI